VSQLVPTTHHALRALHYGADDAMPLVLLDGDSYVRLKSALGAHTLEAAFAPATTEIAGVTVAEVSAERLLVPDLAQRFNARVPEAGASSWEADVWQRVRRYDARIAWPRGNSRPPGDDLYELGSALCAEPLTRALASTEPGALADLLYRFALVTSVGAHWDLLAARQNPGMSAQGVLGLGHLTWAWFIFDALGAQPEAARVARLLDVDWVRVQERGTVTARQRAWFDLSAWLRNQTRGPALGRVRELLPLTERAAWQDPARVALALAVHTEPRADQFTHQPLFYVWPAPLYALAARASALDLLSAGGPFLSRVLRVELVDKSHEMVVWADLQHQRFDAMDQAQLPALLDPLPVIVDVRITEVDATQAKGRTLLGTRDAAEHVVVAAHGGRAMQPGEVWLFEVSGSRQTSARARHDDLGEVAYNIALPTGEWLSRVDPA
jgi:hypothetical protein